MNIKMKSLIGLFLLALLLGGCTPAMSPFVGGGLYTDFEAPLMATSNAKNSKMGIASGSTIIGIGSGDVSISAAMKNGGITRIHHVDTHSKSMLFGLYSEFTLKVYGE